MRLSLVLFVVLGSLNLCAEQNLSEEFLPSSPKKGVKKFTEISREVTGDKESPERRVTWEFNERGYVTKISGPDYPEQTWEYEFSDTGRLLGYWENYASEGGVDQYWEFVYVGEAVNQVKVWELNDRREKESLHLLYKCDPEGLPLELNVYDEGKLYVKVVYEYKEGRLEKFTCSKEDSVDWGQIYHYGESGKLQTKELFAGSGKEEVWARLTYNEYGDQIANDRLGVFDISGNPVRVAWLCEYKYNQAGFKESMTVTKVEGDQKEVTTKSTYEYEFYK